MILNDGIDVEHTTINGEGLDHVGESTKRKLGPIDTFDIPYGS